MSALQEFLSIGTSPTADSFATALPSAAHRDKNREPQVSTYKHQYEIHEHHHDPQQQQQQQQQHLSTQSPDHAAAPVKRPRRDGATHNGCVTCRLRKVKCSGRPGDNNPCTRCSNGNYDCSFLVAKEGMVSRVAPTKDRTEAGTVRKRTQKACRQCHLHKTKCSGDLPHCTRCRTNGKACEYVYPRHISPCAPIRLPTLEDDMKHNTRSRAVEFEYDIELPHSSAEFSLSAATKPPVEWPSIKTLYSEQFLAQKDTTARHFEVFFEFWACMPCMGFMQKETTAVEIDEETLHPVVIAAVCAMTSHVVHPCQAKIPFASRCADQVELYIFRTIESMTCDTATTALIVLVCGICHFWHENQLNKVWVYIGMAARLITGFRLNWDRVGEPCLKQETNRRLVWACYMLDRRLSCGFSENVVLRDDDMHLRLPTTDEALHEATHEAGATRKIEAPYSLAMPNGHSKRPCLDEYHLRLHRLRHEILGFMESLTGPAITRACGPQLQGSQVIRTINNLQNQLVHFKQSLSEHLTLNEANINMLINSRKGPSFIMLHSLLWILHTDLYRFTVPGMLENTSPYVLEQLPTEFILKSQRQAVGYTVSLARFWRQLQGIVAKRPPGDGTERLLTVDHMFAIYVVQPTKILLAARKHHLFDLRDSTAPLIFGEPVNDDALASLIHSNMELIPPLAHFFPYLLEKTRGLREAVEGFS